ncbi:hypothetical protein CDL15_Pgr017126 [Punica granatum]|uniref:Uncharacterized protein n=2 Tax=Punica granatum TaxID=22663 RepID=A0A218VZE0_PUNGR|nr:hypothetical protein CDL15_Pgr017126 [Punica granatum]
MGYGGPNYIAKKKCLEPDRWGGEEVIAKRKEESSVRQPIRSCCLRRSERRAQDEPTNNR